MFDIYTFTAFFLFIFSLITFFRTSKKSQTKKFLFISILWLILYEGLRWEVGTDWNYYDGFINGYDWGGHAEIGYVLLNNTFSSIFNNYTLFLLFLSTFFYIVIYRLLREYSLSPLLSLCIYYCTMLGYLGCNRQLIALMICILSVKYIVDKNKKKNLFILLIAFLFHTTSIFFLPAYWIVNSTIRIRTIIVLVFITLLIGLLRLVDQLPFVNYITLLDEKSAEKLSFYITKDNGAYSYLGTIKRLVIIIPSLILLSRNIPQIYKMFFKLYIVGTMIYFVFNGSILMLMSGRGAMYYNVYEILIVPILFLYFFKNKQMRMLIWIIYFSMILYLMRRDMNFYVIAGVGDIYNPYKSVIF